MQLEHLLAVRTDLWRGRGRYATAPAGFATGFAALDRALPGGGWPPAALSEVHSSQPAAGFALLLPLLVALAREPRWVMLVDPPLWPYGPALAARGFDLTRLVVVQTGPDEPSDAPWAMEQALRSGGCAAVLGWDDRPTAGWAALPGSRPRPRAAGRATAKGSAAARGGRPRASVAIAPWSMPRLRRLQLAAAEGHAVAVLLRPPEAAAAPSPAVLRLAVRLAGAGSPGGPAGGLAGGLAVTLLKLRGGRAGAQLLLRPDLVPAGAGSD